MAIPKKFPETKQEILGYWILQILEFHARVHHKYYIEHQLITEGDWREMKSLDHSLRHATEEAGIELEPRSGTIYAGKKV
jgi:hypothetical protein